MNLETLAAFYGDAWAKRVRRTTPPAPQAKQDLPWPGLLDEARRIAATLGKPHLVRILAEIIQERAKVAWRLRG
jgi:hypothetical protein